MHKPTRWAAITTWLLHVISHVDAQTDSLCCSRVAEAVGASKVVYPNDEAYRRSIASYWGPRPREVQPGCVVLAQSSQDVATAIATVTNSRTRAGFCLFAVRSGGHNPWPDHANIGGGQGVTIDLTAMNSVSLSQNGTIASVGPGARWGDVYEILGRQGRAIVGGRDGRVGVGGLTTGGGLSFFSARYGFVADDVQNFEVVLERGNIVNANANENSDLFRVLKGGSRNFGIVTRFDFVARPQGDLWGGVVVYPGETLPKHIDALVRFTDRIAQDPDASVIIIQARTLPGNQSVITNTYMYTKPEPYPVALRCFTDIKPELTSSLRIANLTAHASEAGAYVSTRAYQGTLTFLNRADVISNVLAMANAKVEEEPFRGAPNISILNVLQPLPRLFSDRSIERGGNILGLDRSAENHVLYALGISWTNPADDAINLAASEAILQSIKDYTESVGADNPYIFLNYASPKQAVLASYGRDNLCLLRNASRKYDNGLTYHFRAPGGFKVPWDWDVDGRPVIAGC